jgi:hypothetical protein
MAAIWLSYGKPRNIGKGVKYLDNRKYRTT